MRRNDIRAHNHPAWWAYLVHRLSGLALGLFLPLHFWALGRALQGDPGLESFLGFADHPLVKFAEWTLVLLLALHLAGGLRLAQVVVWRYFAGLDEAEIAAALNVTERTVRRDWVKARTLLADLLGDLS